MRALRVVGYEEDGSGQPAVILEDPDRRERFTVPADERLRAAARGDVQQLSKMTASSSDQESQLRPREIQARIRAGASVEQVAAVAGVPAERIERFAYPVLLERSRIAEMARDAHPVRTDGPDVRTLQEVVTSTFNARGQEYSHAEWDAWRGDDNKWVVTLSWDVGRSDITARWQYQPGAHGGTVTALDEHSTDLIDGQSRPPRRVGPVIDFGNSAEPAAKAANAGDSSSAGRRANKTTTGRGSGSGSSGSGSAKPAPKPATRATGKAAAPAQPEQTQLTEQPEPETAETTERPAAAASGGAKRSGARKGKPVMPSWEDVLLGVKSQRG
ncbi:hypothetical protein GCM10023321_44600 [Pseudonocardia eucalypti]|uniref:DUF3071 domain-containing protein n=1 Tax=Pseudonocardia eucalypti TaxID=648755 RepID=A0ABP9QFB7_9PSEU|nr:hypothetical protein [Pseudonocardia eucalypti]